MPNLHQEGDGAVVLLVRSGVPRKFRKEYPRLKELFGEELQRHADNVPNFVPRISKWKSGDDRKFSWARVSANHEWGWGLVLTLVMVMIYFVECWSPMRQWLA